MGRRSIWRCAPCPRARGRPVRRPAERPVVPSLEPKTEASGGASSAAAPRAQEGCRPLRGIFYAATDWLRLATKLAATPSPCAEYYVSVPPIVGNKTNLRPGEAARIRALGESFHALAEFHWTTWSRWVTENATTWYAAGVEIGGGWRRPASTWRQATRGR